MRESHQVRVQDVYQKVINGHVWARGSAECGGGCLVVEKHNGSAVGLKFCAQEVSGQARGEERKEKKVLQRRERVCERRVNVSMFRGTG